MDLVVLIVKNVFFIQPIGLGLAALGQAFVVISGGIDLSAGAAISFIGLGVQPPSPDWGKMISTGRIYFIERPWFAGAAGAAIFLVTLAFNLLGDAVRDVADPRTRRAVT